MSDLTPTQKSLVLRTKCPCEGSGSIMTMRKIKPSDEKTKPVWWDCPGCGPGRVNAWYGPPEIKVHSMSIAGDVK